MRGELKPGDRLPSLVEMRNDHSLSRTTVDRVRRSLEKDGLIVREQGRGTFVAPIPSASTLTGLIGFCGLGFREKPRAPYWTHLLEGIQEAAHKEERGVLLLDGDGGFGWDKVDGVLSAGGALHEGARDLPHVELINPHSSVASVTADDYQGAQIATDHLLGLGHTRIGCLMVMDNALAKRRVSGYRDALQVAGITPEAQWARDYGRVYSLPARFRERSYDIMRKWLADDWKALGLTAILAQNDLCAIGIMDALKEAGIDVPGQVSVVGFDSTEICDLVSPRLTSVRIPLQEIAATGLELLLRQIQTGRRTKSVTMLPTELDIRGTTAKPAA